MPTIIQVKDKKFKHHGKPLVVFYTEPVNPVYHVRDPEHPPNKPYPMYLRVEKKQVEFAFKMPTLPHCPECGSSMTLEKVEPHTHNTYWVTSRCRNKLCTRINDTKMVYYDEDE